MSGNVFGTAYRVTTFGESHGPYIGVVIEGVKPGLPVDVQGIQRELDRRRPGQSEVVTPRQEADRVQVISGVFEGKTTGTPICLLIRNQDQRPGDYRQLRDIFRPGHAGFTFLKKYGVFDYRGGGRASGRETATRVAAGALAKQFLRERGIEIIGYTRRIGGIHAKKVDYSYIEQNSFRTPDPDAVPQMLEAVELARRAGDSLGGVVEVVVKHLPAGLGEPVFHKLDADLAGALMSIGAVKAFEIGSGFAAAGMTGSEHNDLYYFDETTGEFHTRTNHAGGVLGGISNGEELVLRITVKPPSSIARPQQTVDRQGKPVTLEIDGRHDPCICPRVVPVAEAMTALVLIDHLLMQERLTRQPDLQRLREAIDTIDVELLLLLAQRKRLICEIASLKKRRRMPVADAGRESELKKRWKTLARELDFPADLLERLIELLLQDSRDSQEGMMK